MDGRKEAGFAAEWRYKLTEDEIYDGLRRSGVRRAGPTRDWVQTVVLALVVVFCLIAFFGGGMQEWGSLTIAVLACALIAVLWIVPALRFRYEAREIAAGTGRWWFGWMRRASPSEKRETPPSHTGAFRCGSSTIC